MVWPFGWDIFACRPTDQVIDWWCSHIVDAHCAIDINMTKIHLIRWIKNRRKVQQQPTQPLGVKRLDFKNKVERYVFYLLIFKILPKINEFINRHFVLLDRIGCHSIAMYHHCHGRNHDFCQVSVLKLTST